MQDQDFEIYTWHRPLILLCGVILLLMGLVCAFGWIAGFHHLIQTNPNQAPIQFNSTLCLILSGCALIAGANQWKKTQKLCGIAVTLMGGGDVDRISLHPQPPVYRSVLSSPRYCH